MSEFSERCRQLLINSGSNVYQMAKHSSLDKTSIQRMVIRENGFPALILSKNSVLI